jgi:hypothetical protein
LGAAVGEAVGALGAVVALAPLALPEPVEPLVELGAATAPATLATALPPSAPATIVAPRSLEMVIFRPPVMDGRRDAIHARRPR